MTDIDRCVCCGNYVPEGRQVCHSCDKSKDESKMSDEDMKMIAWLSSAPDKEIRKQMRRVDKELFGRAFG